MCGAFFVRKVYYTQVYLKITCDYNPIETYAHSVGS